MRRLLRRWYVRWLVLPLLILVAVHAGWTLLLALKFEGRLDRLRAAGAPVEPSDVAPPPAAPEDNAAPLLAKAHEWHHRHLYPKRPGVLDQVPEEQWEPEDRAAVREWLRSGDPYIELLAGAAARPMLQQDLDWDAGHRIEIPTMSQLGMATMFILDRVRYAERSTPRLIRELVIVLDLARKAERPFALTLMVRWAAEQAAARALEGLAKKPGFGARAVRETLDERFAATADYIPLVRDALQGERVCAIYLSRLWIGGESPLEIIGVDDLGRRNYTDAFLGSWFGRPLAYRDAMRGLDLMERALDLVEAPPRKAQSVAASMVDAYEAPFAFVPPMMHLIPGRVFNERLKHLARIRIARVGLALLQRRDETGAWPESLDAAIPLVDAETLVDPYTDERFQYEPAVRLEAAVPISPKLDGEFREEERIVWRFR